ncbi:MAG: hypothetical protein IJY58_06150 [Alphaproteobacteria bacterium]|nr:hypothetical protein [Alphaproteobacteria bacterium]
MKKLLCIGVGLTLLSACTAFEPDLDKAAEERAKNRAEIRNAIGCQFVDDHDAYRRCVIATYENNKPKTYTVAEDCSGQPVAVVSEGVSKGTVMADGQVQTKQVTTTVKEVAVQPAPQPVVQTVPAVQVQPAQVVVQEVAPCGMAANCVYKTQELYEAEMKPCTTCAPQKVIVEQPKVVTVTTTETVVEKPLEVVPAPKPLPNETWWETYQKEKAPAQPKVVCPCPDPNDPCPQCVTK